MKATLTLLVLAFCIPCFSQNYQPLNSGVKKVFISETAPFVFYSLSIDSAELAIDSVFYNYMNVNPFSVNSNCGWWGPQECNRQEFPSWLGRTIQGTGNLTLVNNNLDSLHFNFNIPLGDTSDYYINSSEKFSIVFESADTVSFLGLTDSAEYFRIIHADLAGNPVSSPLNGKEIILTKNSGLINFFQVDSFPQILKPLRIEGITHPDNGITALTSEMLYDYQPLDEVQYYKAFYQQPGPPWLNYQYYVMYRFLNKSITSDSVIYQAARTMFYVDSTFIINDTVMLSYYRFDTIARIPFEFYNGSVNQLLLKSYCGMNMLTFISTPTLYSGYCATENCWGPIDTGGPLPFEGTTYVAGLGVYDRFQLLSTPNNSLTDINRIVYFKKNGIACDTPVVMSNHELQAGSNEPVIFPNPGNNFSIKSAQKINKIIIYNSMGQVKYISDSETETILTIGWQPGVYTIYLESGKERYVKKAIVQN